MTIKPLLNSNTAADIPHHMRPEHRLSADRVCDAIRMYFARCH
jgi:hypothetical protein